MHAASVTAGSIDSLEQADLQLGGTRALCVLRIRLSDSALVPELSNYLARMGFNAEKVADGTVEVAPISPVSPSYDTCTMRAYFRSWHERHAEIEAELSA
jgi:hypothetical protein